MSTTKQIKANQENAKLSTGPKTPEGKDKSSRNAIQHGMCSKRHELIDDDDHEAHRQREEDWNARFNPTRCPVAAYFVDLAVRHTIHLDHGNASYQARTADRMRNALKSHNSERASQVEILERLITDEPDIAVRKLKETPEGVAWLIKQTLEFITPFGDIDIEAWEKKHLVSWQKLRGNRYGLHDQGAPAPFEKETHHIVNYYNVRDSLAIDEDPEQIYWNQRYTAKEAHEFDIFRFDVLRVKAFACRDVILGEIYKDVRELRALKAELEIEEQATLDDLIHRVKFDSCNDDRLLDRYSHEHARALSRCFKDIQVLQKTAPADVPVKEAGRDMTQDTVNKDVMIDQASVPQAGSEAASSRNKANSDSPESPQTPISHVKSGSKSRDKRKPDRNRR